MGIFGTLHPLRILLTLGAISVYGSISQGEPRTYTLRSGAQFSANWTTVAPKMLKNNLEVFVKIIQLISGQNQFKNVTKSS